MLIILRWDHSLRIRKRWRIFLRVFLFLVFTQTVRVPWGGSHGVHERIRFFFCSHVFGFLSQQFASLGRGLFSHRWLVKVCAVITFLSIYPFLLLPPGIFFLGDPGMCQRPLADGGRESITCPASLRFLVFLLTIRLAR